MDVISTNVKHAEFKNQKISKENLLIVCYRDMRADKDRSKNVCTNVNAVNEGYRCHNERCNKCNINKPQ
jgi:ferredoxin-fold anticodon binding domain-containing protein